MEKWRYLLKTEGGYDTWNQKLEATLSDVLENDILKNIFSDNFVHRPEDPPFALWEISNDGKLELSENQIDFLRDLAEEDICEYNKARIYDFLWFTKKDFKAALLAYQYYEEYISRSEKFEYNFIAANRMISIFLMAKSQGFNKNKLCDLIRRILQQEKNEGKVYYLIETCYKNKLLENTELINTINSILNQYPLNSKEFQLIGLYTDLLEKILCDENNLNRKAGDNSEVKKARKRNAQALLAAADYFSCEDAGSGFQKVHYMQKAVNVLKTISGTEEERKEILRAMAEIQKKSASQVPRYSVSIDNSEQVKALLDSIERLNKEELLYCFAMLPLFPRAEQIRERALNRFKGVFNLFPSAMLNNEGKKVAISKQIFDGQKLNESALADEMERIAKMEIDMVAQSIIGNMRNVLIARYPIEEIDVECIVEKSAFVSEERRQLFTKGLLAGFRGDMMTALCILIPQVEKSVRDLAEMCDEVVYNIKEDSTEELKTFNGILDLPNVKACLDDDLLLVLRTVFCSKFGFNMRNEIAHGTVSDRYFLSFGALYAWWLAFRLCYMFCGRSRYDMQEQVMKKMSDNLSGE